MKILSLEADHFRGVKKLRIDPEGRSLVIYGPNGTGKSAVVDAVDFLLTGRITRLTGEGSKELALKEHGCHVDARGKLKSSLVKASVQLDGHVVRLQRSIDKPSSLLVEPEEQREIVEACIDKAQLGQCILSRRELLKYITAEAGKRSVEIMTLLDLGSIEAVRKVLVSVKNTANNEAKAAESGLAVAESEVASLVELGVFSEAAVLEKVNELRKTFDVPPVEQLSSSGLQAGITGLASTTKGSEFTKGQMEGFVAQLKTIAADDAGVRDKQNTLTALIEGVKKAFQHEQYAAYRRLIDTGLQILGNSNTCPLCDRPWQKGDFRAYLLEKKQNTEVLQRNETEISDLSTAIRRTVETLKNVLINLGKAREQCKISPLDPQKVEDYLADLQAWSDAMLSPLDAVEGGKWPARSLDGLFSDSLLEELTGPLEEGLKSMGDQMSEKQSSWDTLTRLEVKWGQRERERAKNTAAQNFKDRAVACLAEFQAARDAILEGIYSSVKGDFDQYYKEIHKADESAFESTISQKQAELILHVDFYGRGMFPPNAVHSEGHQDSMGLCLFLALNRYLSGDAMKVIVLDDVVMSIDRGHRNAVCNVLKTFFPDKQFIITTHEAAWAKQLNTERVVEQKNMLHFVNWNVDTGPICEQEKDLWEKIAEDLARDDVPSAAQKLRHNAECFFENACDLLGATITYKGDHLWSLGDYAPAATSAYLKYVKRGKDVARKAGRKEQAEQLTTLEERAKTVVDKSQIGQWPINRNIHFSKWDEFSREDFAPVVESFKNLFNLFMCDSCGNMIHTVEIGGKKAVACYCGAVHWPTE